MTTSTGSPQSPPRTATRGEGIVSGCLVGGPLLLLAADMIDAHPSRVGTVEAIATHPARHSSWVLLGLTGCLLLGVAMFGVAARLLHQRPTLALVGGALSGLGVTALAAQRGLHIALLALASSPLTTDTGVLDRIDRSGPVVILVITAIAGTWLGQLVLGVGLWRSRLTPVWVPALMVLTLVVALISTTPVPSDLLTLLALGWIGISRRPRGDRPPVLAEAA